jgi:hypothetical protein
VQQVLRGVACAVGAKVTQQFITMLFEYLLYALTLHGFGRPIDAR